MNNQILVLCTRAIVKALSGSHAINDRATKASVEFQEALDLLDEAENLAYGRHNCSQSTTGSVSATRSVDVTKCDFT